jgi:ATP-binding cassette, subfamily B, bacterial
VGSTLPVLFQSFGIAKQAFSVMQDPQDITDVPGSSTLNVISGEILFDAVSFQYGEQQLFQNKHVHIRGGQRIGLVGYTGSGQKSKTKISLGETRMKRNKKLYQSDLDHEENDLLSSFEQHLRECLIKPLSQASYISMQLDI